METQEEKDAFLEAKNAEAKTKLEEQRAKSKAQEDVIDKLLNLQTLTTEEELVRQEIVKEREERKAKFQEKE
ncbi:MAG: hypothetical protein LBQ24_01815 [Candidatus Peribacteria bacterium]|nr:hypothetical protein [Candidatus Peribacteria bacterium]